MKLDKILWYDTECFPYLLMFVFMDKDNNTIVFNNSLTSECGKWELKDLVRDHVLIGFNNFFYDDPMLDTVLKVNKVDTQKMYQLSKSIIGGEVERYKPVYVKSLDTRQQMDMNVSLKFVEASRSDDIIESDLSWDLDRPLTQEEYDDTLHYCIHDVKHTKALYEARYESYFMIKEAMSDNLQQMKYNSTTLSIMDFKTSPRWFSTRTPVEFLDYVPAEVQRGFEKGEETKIKEFGNEIIFGEGGLHGFPVKNKGYYPVVTFADVNSMYPYIMVNHNILGVNAPLFEKMIKDRFEAKKAGDNIKQLSLKVKINSIYGLLNNKYSKIYNPKAAKTVCQIGMITCYTMARLAHELGYNVININTDGIAIEGEFTENDMKYIDNQIKEMFNLELEYDKFYEYNQTNVNNYSCLTDAATGNIIDDIYNGHFKVKGLLNKIHKNEFSLNKFNVKHLVIVDIMVLNKLAYNISFTDTLLQFPFKEYPQYYQMITKASGNFPYIKDATGKLYQKVNRLFAVKNGIAIYKSRDGITEYKIAKVPDSVYVHNESIITDLNTELDINYDYYIEEAERIYASY